ncbi:hypothetical protein [Streptomyces sp. NPDC089799]|uniref:hypothetical protein n=1 Tax=Streptomyces sp. NPDC089799 TaxID=3155066 RepID=UPI00344662B1
MHGVGGPSPEELLGDPRTVRITGDDTAAVFRRAEDADAEAHPGRYAGQPVTEAYCWSRLTSGNGARALWLLLLPFMVANLAHWARPSAPADGRAARAYGVLVRLVALSLTVLLVASACEVALDLAAWQCAGSARCTASRSWLGFLSGFQPGRRLALAALVPASLTGLLWYLSNRTWSAYESQAPPRTDPDRPHPAPTHSDGTPALGRPGFWYGRRLVARLRAAHTAAGLLTVAAAVTVPAADFDRRSAGGPPDGLGWCAQAALAAGAAVVVWVVCRRGRAETRLDHRIDRAVVSLLPGAALALLALCTGYACWSRPGWTATGRLPGDAAFGLIMLGQGCCALALVAVTVPLRRAARTPGRTPGRAQVRTAGRTPVGTPAVGGFGGPAVALLACALGGVMAGGLAQRVADWLDGGATPGEPGAPLPGPPVLLSWQSSVLPPLLLALLLPAVLFGLRGARLRRRIAATVADEYPGQPYDRDRSRRIAAARATAGLTDSTPWFVAAVSGLTLVLGAGALAGARLTGEVPEEAARGTHPWLEAAAGAAQDAGSWLIGFGFLLFVTWGRRAYRDASARRTIGILWDVGTFWPRAAHPFAPPCYAERAVPDLTWRITSWTARTGGHLVLSGHSQGSVLAAAAVWQLPPAVRRRVALLTHGSPLARLYGRWFPAYFGPADLAALHREVDCWRNLWRATDPIGGPVLSGTGERGRGPGEGPAREGVDRGPLADPLAYGRTELHPLPAPILGHSDYPADPVFAAERTALLRRLAVREGAGGVPDPHDPDVHDPDVHGAEPPAAEPHEAEPHAAEPYEAEPGPAALPGPRLSGKREAPADREPPPGREPPAAPRRPPAGPTAPAAPTPPEAPEGPRGTAG